MTITARRPATTTAAVLLIAGLAGTAQGQRSTEPTGNGADATTPPKTQLHEGGWGAKPRQDSGQADTRANNRSNSLANNQTNRQTNRQSSPPPANVQAAFVALPDTRAQLNETSDHTPAPSDRRFRLFGEMPGTDLPGIHDHEPASPVLTQITSTFDGADFDPQISRDGRFLVYASTQHRETSDIYLRHTHGSVITRVTSDPADDVMPAVTPDGNRIAFTSNRAGNWDIYVMPASGGRAIQITATPEQEIHPSWSPDGRHLVFSRFGQSSGRWEMWVTEVDNPSTSRFIGYGLFPEWCPVPGTGYAGGDRILFQRSRERGDRAFTVWSLEYREGIAGNMTEIVSSPTAALINPTWAPGGDAIIYAEMPLYEDIDGAAIPLETGEQPANLWMIGIEGFGKTSLTAGETVDLMPTWGTDGRVYFVSDRGGRDNLWAIEVSQVIRTAQGAAPWSFELPGSSGTAVAAEQGTGGQDPRAGVFNNAAPASTGPGTVPAGNPITAFREMPQPQRSESIFATAPTNGGN